MNLGDYVTWHKPSQWGGTYKVTGRVLSTDGKIVVIECKEIDPYSGHEYKTWNEFAPAIEVTLLG